jgi:hypothetical protein
MNRWMIERPWWKIRLPVECMSEVNRDGSSLDFQCKFFILVVWICRP